MTTMTALPMNLLPAPRFNRQGDYIWVSTIYPLDADGAVVHADAPSPYVGEAEVAAQTRAVCEGLKDTLAEAGTSMDRVLKAEVYLVDPAEFYEFKLVWQEYFPSAPPARTTAVVMDEHIIRGARLSVSAVALAGDSAVQKETIHVDDVPDPMPAEWVPQATKGGIFVFPSAVPATDFETGIAVKTNPVAPYYGSEAELQTRYIFENWAKVLAAAGSGLDQGLKSQGMEVSLWTFHDMDAIWGEYMGRGAGVPPPGRSSMAMRGLLVPDALLVVNCFFLAPDAQHQKVESREGIRWHPEDVRNVHFSPRAVGGRLVLHGRSGGDSGLRELRLRDGAARTAVLLLRHRDSDGVDDGAAAGAAGRERPLPGQRRGCARLPGARAAGLPGLRARLAPHLGAGGPHAEHEPDPLAPARWARRDDDGGTDRGDRSDRPPWAGELARPWRRQARARHAAPRDDRLRMANVRVVADGARIGRTTHDDDDRTADERTSCAAL